MTWFYIPYTFLPEPEAESLPTSCSDTDQSEPLKLSSIRETCCCDTSLPENFLTSLFGTMLEVSQSTTTQRNRSLNDCAESEKTSVSQADSLVRVVQPQEKDLDSKTQGQDSGKNLPESFAKFDHDTSSWKTPTCLLDEDLTLYSLTLPKCGILLRGELFPLPTSALHTCGNAFGRLAPHTHTHTHTTNANSNGAREQRSSNRKDNEQTQFRPDELRRRISDAGNDNNGRLFGEQEESDEQSKSDCGRKTFNARWQRWKAESIVGGMADGISDWLDDCRNGTLWTPDEKGLARIAVDIPNRAARLKAIGNAQVPLCAAVAFVTLKEILDNYDT